MIYIPLVNVDIPALVDDEYEWMLNLRWKAEIRRGRIHRVMPFYLNMHRMIMEPEPYVPIDHINRKPWDNRLENLRLSTTLENNRNRGKRR